MPVPCPTLNDAVRSLIYGSFVETGRAPSAAETAAALSVDPTRTERAYRDLGNAHAMVLAPDGLTVRMAHPFSGAPTPYVVTSAGISYWANCAWDTLGIAAILGRDTEAIARCPDCGESIDLSVQDGKVCASGVIHFVVPPHRFWDDIGYT